jgi:hypothetical protein
MKIGHVLIVDRPGDVRAAATVVRGAFRLRGRAEADVESSEVTVVVNGGAALCFRTARRGRVNGDSPAIGCIERTLVECNAAMADNMEDSAVLAASRAS